VHTYKITSLGRSLDINNSRHRTIIILSILTGLSSSLFQMINKSALIDIFSEGIKAAIILFLVWAIAREIDPDHENSAFASVVLAIPIVIIQAGQPIVPLVWILLSLRTIDRSVGIKAGIVDSLIIIALGSILSITINWIFLPLTILVFITDKQLSIEGKNRYLMQTAIIAAILIFLSTFKTGTHTLYSNIPHFIATSIVFVPFIVSSKTLKSVGDISGELLNKSRVNAAQIALLLCYLFLSTIEYGNHQLLGIIMIGVGIYQLIPKTLKT
jgi:hypothetical protein